MPPFLSFSNMNLFRPSFWSTVFPLQHMKEKSPHIWEDGGRSNSINFLFSITIISPRDTPETKDGHEKVLSHKYCNKEVSLIEIKKTKMTKVSSVQFSRSFVSDSLRPHGLEHTRPPCPSLATGVYSNSCPLGRWCHATISSSVVPFSSHLQSIPASGSCPMSQFFTSGGQSIGVSASTSVLPMNIQNWFLYPKALSNLPFLSNSIACHCLSSNTHHLFPDLLK